MQTVSVAVSGTNYAIDKPYTYLVPEEYSDLSMPGLRVIVPFSKSDKFCEGVILSSDESDNEKGLKRVAIFPEKEPVITADQIKLAYFMRERFFCTVYGALKAMIPSGLWFNPDGSRKIPDKKIRVIKLNIQPGEERILKMKKSSPAKFKLVKTLIEFGDLEANELITYAGVSSSTLKACIDSSIVSVYSDDSFRTPEILRASDNLDLPQLSPEQLKVYTSLNRECMSGTFGVSLLHGITGSGKTAIYLHLISEQLNKGKSAIVLVPEISLTPQTIKTFQKHFGDKIAVLHSGLSDAERCDEWRRIKTGKASLVIGTRSAVFAPVNNLGLIIIDEEHDSSYRSESSPRYNAADIAKFRCMNCGCMLVLGSATPDLCSMYSASQQKYNYYRLDKRFNRLSLPEVKIVDMKRSLRNGVSEIFSNELLNSINTNINNGEQSILFVNRRGAHKLISCEKCGYTFRCPHCSVNLTHHSVNSKLVCHYCGYRIDTPAVCPDCGGNLKFHGAGTQLVDEELKLLIPGISTIRLDADNVSEKGSHDKILSEFQNRGISVLIGTQMVVKGFNFDNVTLVGVLDADQSLYSGDYKSGENTFSLLTQVIGRCGRGSKTGRAIIQTYTPENEIILRASEQNYDLFYESEIQMRRLQNAPPFTELFSINISGHDENAVLKACSDIRSILLKQYESIPDVNIAGPAPFPVVKLMNNYRYRIFIYCKKSKNVRSMIHSCISSISQDRRFNSVTVYPEYNPSN